MYLVIYKDALHVPRAWGCADRLSEAQKRAKRELDAYCNTGKPSVLRGHFSRSVKMLDARGRIVGRTNPSHYGPSHPNFKR